MKITDITPETNELVNVDLDSPHLLASTNASGRLMLSGGTLPNGCATLDMRLAEGDYASEMKAAVIAAVAEVNMRYGKIAVSS